MKLNLVCFLFYKSRKDVMVIVFLDKMLVTVTYLYQINLAH